MLMHSLIDAERQRQQQEDHAADELLPEWKSMIGVMLSLQESDLQQYTDTFIAALVTVSTTPTGSCTCNRQKIAAAEVEWFF
jgi:hypothetical protein